MLEYLFDEVPMPVRLTLRQSQDVTVDQVEDHMIKVFLIKIFIIPNNLNASEVTLLQYL